MDVTGWLIAGSGVALVLVTWGIEVRSRLKAEGARDARIVKIEERQQEFTVERQRKDVERDKTIDELRLMDTHTSLRLENLSSALALHREEVARDNVRHEHINALENRLSKSIEAMGAQLRRDIDGIAVAMREQNRIVISTVREELRKSTDA